MPLVRLKKLHERTGSARPFSFCSQIVLSEPLPAGGRFGCIAPIQASGAPQ